MAISFAGKQDLFLFRCVFFYLRRAGMVRRYFYFSGIQEERKTTGMKANTDIRYAIKAAGLKNWQIAEALKISENTLSRRLRHELAPEGKKQILDIIQELKGVPAP